MGKRSNRRYETPVPNLAEEIIIETGSGEPSVPANTTENENDTQQEMSALRNQLEQMRIQLETVTNVAHNNAPNTQNGSRNTRQHLTRPAESSSDDQDDGQEHSTFEFVSDSGASRVIDGRHIHRQYRTTTSRDRTEAAKCKLPNYYGKEKWAVWFNRFDEVARRNAWNDNERLDVLIPRLQGLAGEFVFDQLSPAIRRDYSSLVTELNNRFRTVETSKSYQIKFNNRVQNVSESVENYAAELKRLYAKAYPSRESKTKEEDLLRKFYEGVVDQQARFQVEYVKDPCNIDEAVRELVNLQETQEKLQNKRDKVMKAAVQDSSDEESSSSEEHHVARLPDRRQSEKHRKRSENFKEKLDNLEKANRDLMRKLNEIIEEKGQKQEDAGRAAAIAPAKDHSANRGSCYVCQETTHFARECPNKETYATCQICRRKGHYATNCPDRFARNPNEPGAN